MAWHRRIFNRVWDYLKAGPSRNGHSDWPRLERSYWDVPPGRKEKKLTYWIKKTWRW